MEYNFCAVLSNKGGNLVFGDFFNKYLPLTFRNEIIFAVGSSGEQVEISISSAIKKQVRTPIPNLLIAGNRGNFFGIDHFGT